ncbi:glycosyltransferase family 2 protein [Microvirga massiliensis]|uniref:glycosyltransferase family 2 protein n=1 Tax=Microvirga massiliensis TaxID=1033741 RepID=UPI000660B449|nr:glycosyltransferase family 2 protein [Microvirga massiliensis]
MVEKLQLTPLNDLEHDGDLWIATGEDPQFLLSPPSGRYPGGWSLIRFEAEGERTELSPVLYVDSGSGFSEAASYSASVYDAGRDGILLRLPEKVLALRLDPLSGRGRFRIDNLRIERIGSARAVWRRISPALARARRVPRLVLHYVANVARIARSSGLRGVLRHALHAPAATAGGDYAKWIRCYDTLTAEDCTKIAARISAMHAKPTISVVVPIYNTPERLLRRCIESVLAQLWPHWELCLADDASPAPHVPAICEEYARRDRRIRFTRRETNGHIAAASNTALGMASGEFVALLDHDDELAPHALYMVVEALATQPDLDLIFTDEDKIDEYGRRHEPWFKSDWNYDLMLSQNAVVHLAVYRRRLVEEVGGFRSGFDGSQDYDLTLRIAERTTSDRIHHIPFVLYHWRATSGSVALSVDEKDYPYEAAVRAVQDHLDRTGRAGARVERQDHPGYYRIHWPLPPESPRVAVIIPTRDKVDLLRVSVSSILTRTDYPTVELIIVDNGSVEDETRKFLHELEKQRSVRVLRYDKPYSFAALNNWAVSQTTAPLVAFVNNDIEVITASWLSEMVARALRPDVGAVGAKLYYPNGTIQHAGIIVGIGGLAGHPHLGLSRNEPGYFGRAACAQSLSAVTAACMVIRRDVFLAVGGFNERDFAIAFNDVDLGLRLNQAGYSVVWTPHAELFHHESASLGPPTDKRRSRQFEEECANLRRRWIDVSSNDPFYNPNLTLSGGDWSLAFPPRVRKPWEAECGVRPGLEF